MPSRKSPSQVWNFVLRNALKIPYARVDRERFLRTELSRYANAEQVDIAIEFSPCQAGINIDRLDRIAKSIIEDHLLQVSAISFGTGIPGGWWMLGTVPADLAQFYYNVLKVLQKLAYVYGWPELFNPDDLELGDDELLLLTLFVGSMFGIETSRQALSSMAEALVQQMASRLPDQAVRHWGTYLIAQRIGRIMGVTLTREGFARGASKLVPILGGVISGIFSYYSFKPMAYRLQKHLRDLALAKRPRLLIQRDATPILL